MVAFEARVSLVDENANVTIAVQTSMPYRVTAGAGSTHQVSKSGGTIRQPVTIVRTSASPTMSYIILEIVVAISGESQEHSCFVYIGHPLAVHLKAVRAESGDSQQAVADAIGMSRSVVSRAERGLGLSPETEAKIAEMLK
jgi:DNA-binding XRE family transcriptional regulator